MFSFGQSSSPAFGQPSFGFGQPSSSAAGFGGFGGFGQSSAAAFGAPSAPALGGFGGFGQSSASPGFGFGQSSAAGFGGFGQPPSGGFGQPSSGGFGGFGAAPAFGAPSSSAGGFGFGQPAAGFGQSSSAAGFGGFGQPAPAGQPGGLNPFAGAAGPLYPKFEKITTQEGSPPMTVNFHTITRLDPFRNYSLEQFHWLEYEAKMQNRPSLWAQIPDPQKAQGAVAKAPPTAAPSAPAFGTFGQPAASSSAGGFGFGGFGQPQQSSSGGMFGGGSVSGFGGFGPSGAAATPFGGFGFGAASSSAAAAPFGGFGAPAGATPFGQSSGAASPFGGFGGFGAASSSSPFALGGQSSSAPFGGFGGFGQSSSAAATPFGFGQSSAASPFGGGFGGFGQSSSAAGFGGFGAPSSSAAFGLGMTPFGQSSQAGGFGQAAPGFGFGQSSSATGFGFGSSSAPALGFGAPSSSAAFGGFGGFGQSSSGGMFGAAPSPFGTFGSSSAAGSFGFNRPSSSGLSFGMSSSAGGFGFGQPAGGFGQPGFGGFSSAAASPFGASPGFGSPSPFGTPANAFGAPSPFGFNTLQQPMMPQGTPQDALSIALAPYGNNPVFNLITQSSSADATFNSSSALSIVAVKSPASSPQPPTLSGLATPVFARPRDRSIPRSALWTSSLFSNVAAEEEKRPALLPPTKSVIHAELFCSPMKDLRALVFQEPDVIPGEGRLAPPGSPAPLWVESGDQTPGPSGRSALDTPGSVQKVLTAQFDTANTKLPTMQGGEYTMRPSLDALLSYSAEALQRVPNFEVAREGVGRIRFLRPVDLTGVRLDAVVRILPGEVGLYVDGQEAPPPNQGLNVDAECTLLNVFPKKHEAGQPFEGRRLERFMQKLQDVPNTEFVEYDGETGTWKFIVRAGDWKQAT